MAGSRRVARRVTPTTVTSAQERSYAYTRENVDSKAYPEPLAPGSSYDPSNPKVRVQDQLIDPGGIPIGYQRDINPRYELRDNPYYSPPDLLPEQINQGPVSHTYESAAAIEARENALLPDRSFPSWKDTIPDPDDPYAAFGDLKAKDSAFDAMGDAQAAQLAEMMQLQLTIAQADADTMIDLAVDAAAQPYDERLRRVGRDITDIAGKMDDLDKITDYYLSTLVEPWRNAADEARRINSADIQAQAAGMVAAIGEQFDVSNTNVQAYLDRIGGVPVSQRVAITDAMQYMRSPFEGMTEAEGRTIASVTDAYGTMLEKQAERGLTQMTLEAEQNRFVADARLGDAMEQLNMERDDLIGDRTRAVDRARQKAQIENQVSGAMPDRWDFMQSAAFSHLENIGMDPVQQKEWQSAFNELRSGSGLWVGDDPETGNPVYLSASDPVALELAFAALPDWAQDPQLLEILQPMLAGFERAGIWHDSRTTQFTGTSGSTAPENWANRNQPNYVQRANMTTAMRDTIENKFPGLVWNGQWRNPEDTAKDPRRLPNSDHLSGGAIDFNPAPGPAGEAEADAAAAWLRTLPNVSYVLWKEAGHYDHIHVSFRLPEQIGEGAVANNFSDPVFADEFQATLYPTEHMLDAVDPGTAEAIRNLLGPL